MTEPTIFDDKVPLRIEVTSTEVTSTEVTASDTREVLSLGPAVKELSDAAVRHAFSTIYSLARRSGDLIEALQHQERHASLSGVELEFGLKFDGNVDAYIAQTGGEASVSVKISWQPGQEVQRD